MIDTVLMIMPMKIMMMELLSLLIPLVNIQKSTCSTFCHVMNFNLVPEKWMNGQRGQIVTDHVITVSESEHGGALTKMEIN